MPQLSKRSAEVISEMIELSVNTFSMRDPLRARGYTRADILQAARELAAAAEQPAFITEADWPEPANLHAASPGHGRIMCSCGAVIAQCKCPHNEGVTETRPHPSCQVGV